MNWITPDGKGLDRKISGARVLRVDELRHRPGRFSVRVVCDSHEQATDILRRFSTQYYRRQKVFCEPYVPLAVRKRARLKSPPRHTPGSRSLKSPRPTQNRRGDRTPPSRLRERRHHRQYESAPSDSPIYVEFSANTLNFEPEDSFMDIPVGRHVNFSGTEESRDSDDDDDDSRSRSKSPVKHRARTPLYAPFFTPRGSFADTGRDYSEIACYDSDSDVPILGE